MTDWFSHGSVAETVSVNDRAVQYGDGVFETVAIRDGRPRFWHLHMQRLELGCRRLGLAPPVTSLLERDLERALAQSSANPAFCTAKIVITAGIGERGYRRAPDARSNTLVGVFGAKPLDAAVYRDGVVVRRCDTRVSTQPHLAGIKSLNRLDQVLARNEWDDAAIFEGLMQDSDGRLVCGTMSNLFAVRQNAIMTPVLEAAGVAGIMRRRIMDLLGENDVECVETEITPESLADMDEIFLSNSQFGVVPVRACDGLAWPVGEATRSVMALLSYDGVPECRV